MPYTPRIDMGGMEIVANTLKVGATKPGTGGGTTSIGIYSGSGVPSFSATKGSLYTNTAGSGTANRLYVNNGTTNWVAVTTAS